MKIEFSNDTHGYTCMLDDAISFCIPLQYCCNNCITSCCNKHNEHFQYHPTLLRSYWAYKLRVTTLSALSASLLPRQQKLKRSKYSNRTIKYSINAINESTRSVSTVAHVTVTSFIRSNSCQHQKSLHSFSWKCNISLQLASYTSYSIWLDDQL